MKGRKTFVAAAGSQAWLAGRSPRRREGAAAVEYALIAAVILVAIIVASAELGRQVTTVWHDNAEETLAD
ncbi:Flp family type IVb pilin [Chelativorans sp. SCAU2101]|jgi:Flp/Fap pilin component.|uniref:Flp family type IVb pilin n=1 Tax=Chelativorans petroleitrophicus TaxID=2975484 RepID=A0A9X2X4Z1_9HYPH|nr:Flp family type IVb pilin [Chelativorans petroleitrophicus]MCT8988765.1 Flp family type IVb pilin [Chelativorans petroleitrophicus]